MSVWHEVVVGGGESSLRGFVAGFLAAGGTDEVVLFGRDLDVRAASLGERLRDLVGAGAHHALLAPAGVSQRLAAALASRGGEAELRFEHISEVVAAAFAFTAEAYAPEVAARIEAAFHDAVPSGVTVEAFREEEKIDQDARGAELYAPSHDYTYHAKGRVAGALAGVLELHRRAQELDFVKVEAITLETRELGQPHTA
jgi:hypothetical protein